MQDPELLPAYGLADYFDPDAVSGISVPLRHYANEPARDDIPDTWKNSNDDDE